MPAGKQPEIGSNAPAWERWRLAGVFHGETFHHPLAAGTAALPGKQPSSGGSLIVYQRYNPEKKRNRHKKYFFFAPFVAFCGLNL
jgi:hypothetical protein